MSAFDARDLLDCYARGVFPMADAREDDRVFLIDPDQRGVLPLNGFRVSTRLARTVRRDPFDVRIDSAFHEVILACAAPGSQRLETWINRPIEGLYLQLQSLGHAHSVECWRAGELVGGLYGVCLKGAFFGESMFSRQTDASKVALVHLVARLLAGGYRLLDAQFMTDHLRQFGAEEIGRAEYLRRLADALTVDGDFYGLGSVDGLGASGGFGAGGGGSAITGAAGSSLGDTLGGGAFANVGAVPVGRATTGVSGREALQLIAQAS